MSFCSTFPRNAINVAQAEDLVVSLALYRVHL